MANQVRASGKRRIVLVVQVVALVVIAWLVKLAMVAALSDGSAVDLGPLQLRLTYNTGVAFSLGQGLPDGVVLAGTALVTVVLAGYAWVSATSIPWPGLVGLGGILSGALTNLLSRAVDGAVADYFHTGWFPTFNLPDTLITVGAVLVVLAALRPAAKAEGGSTA
ncbi:signal peptidase II [Actinomycetes bacterium KLBMP 9759]